MDKPKILIVEDDPDVSDMLTAFFGASDYEVVTAAWGADALRAAHDHTFSLVMLDIRLPDISGYDVCRQLRLERRTAGIPIVFLTEKRDRVDKLQGLELGVTDYITKPFDMHELRLRVRNAIQRASQQHVTNPVTELPEAPLSDEKLHSAITSDEKWGVLTFSIEGMERLRESYGFVAADEMLRAVTLIARGAIREFGAEGDFLGHLGPADFVIITHADRLPGMQGRISARVGYSLERFYKPKDAADELNGSGSLLSLRIAALTHADGRFASVDALKAALGAK